MMDHDQIFFTYDHPSLKLGFKGKFHHIITFQACAFLPTTIKEKSNGFIVRHYLK